MKITMFEVEASADDLRASRSVAESLTMAIQRVTDVFCGFGESVRVEEPDQEEEDEMADNG